MRSFHRRKLINSKNSTYLIQMPQVQRRKFVKSGRMLPSVGRANSKVRFSSFLKEKSAITTRRISPSFVDPIRPRHFPSLPRKVLTSDAGETKMIERVPVKTKMLCSKGAWALKSQNTVSMRLPKNCASLQKKASTSNIITEALMKQEQLAPQFLSLLIAGGKMIKHKKDAPAVERKFGWNEETTKRPSYANVLGMFQTLSNEPLTLLELHFRFDVSKQTVKRLVKNGFFREVWGPKAVGVRFSLTKKGKIYLKELDSTSKIEPKIREHVRIKLKHVISP